MKDNHSIDNAISSNRLFDLLKQAELSARLGGASRRAYLMRNRKNHVGAVRREIDRIVALGDRGCDLFMDYFFNEFEETKAD